MSDLEEEKKLIKNQIAEIEKNIAKVELEQQTPFFKMTYEEQKKDLIKRALPGKCPVRFIEGDGKKIDLDNALVRQPYETFEELNFTLKQLLSC